MWSHRNAAWWLFLAMRIILPGNAVLVDQVNQWTSTACDSDDDCRPRSACDLETRFCICDPGFSPPQCKYYHRILSGDSIDNSNSPVWEQSAAMATAAASSAAIHSERAAASSTASISAKDLAITVSVKAPGEKLSGVDVVALVLAVNTATSAAWGAEYAAQQASTAATQAQTRAESSNKNSASANAAASPGGEGETERTVDMFAAAADVSAREAEQFNAQASAAADEATTLAAAAAASASQALAIVANFSDQGENGDIGNIESMTPPPKSMIWVIVASGVVIVAFGLKGCLQDLASSADRDEEELMSEAQQREGAEEEDEERAGRHLRRGGVGSRRGARRGGGGGGGGGLLAVGGVLEL